MESASLDLPSWIFKRDGRLVPFEADKISRSLFAATESLGNPNAFLARELTDSVVHFLQAETDNSIPTTAQVAELAEKVVRELGQPELAQGYAVFRTGRAAAVKTGAAIPSDYLKEEEKEKTLPQIQPVGPSTGQLRIWLEQEIAPNFSIRQAGQACLREFSLREVFTRDLAAASREGLLTLTGLESPREFYGTSLETFKISNQSILSTLEEAREVTGQFLAIDGLEYAVVSSSQYQKAPAAKVVQEIATALRLTHLQAIVDLNCAFPPEWANDLAKGPLFSQPDESQNREQIRELGTVLAEEWLQGGTPQAGRIGWHLRATDFEPGQQASLLRLVGRALEGLPILFIFDRPRRPISLAEGLDRNHPAVLLQVGLHLPKLLEQPGTRSNPDKFLKKLGSLVRLALSAGAQKRDYLRKAGRNRPGLTRGFLLDRARLVVVPVGIETAVRELTGQGIGSAGSGLDFGRKIITILQEVLVQDAKATHLETCLDSAPDFMFADKFAGFPGLLPNPPMPEAAGLTAWDETVPYKNQLKCGGILHGVAECGTAAVMVSSENTKSPETIVDLLHCAFSQTDVVRLQFIQENPPSLAK